MPRGLAMRYWREFEGARNVLDVGCGSGEFARCRPWSGIDVHGIDVDGRAVELASRHERAIRVDLDAEALPYEDATFDAVLAKDVFEHVMDPGELAREIYRVTRPAGVMVASVVMARPRRVWADYTHRRGFTRESARLLLEDAGFHVEATWRMGPVPLSSKLNFIDRVPDLLRVPVFDALWGASWELRARK
jgi:2-polyprenyl-3-methyl-5-hydroxy-6-metoxy-1,4-benzoquinol methylase